MVFLIWRLGASQCPRSLVTSEPLLALMLGWCGWLAISSIWSPPLAQVADGLLDLGVMAAFVVMAAVVAGYLSSKAVDSIWPLILIAAFIYFAAAMAEGPGGQGRYAAPGGGPNVFVRVMVLGTIAALYLNVSRRSGWVLISIPFFGVGAVFSGSRGGLLSGAIVALIGSVPIARHLGVRRAIALLIGGVAATWITVSVTGQTGSDFMRQRFVRQTLVEQYTAGRESIASGAIDLFKSRPVTGVGLDGYYGLRGIYINAEYPHNLFLATAAEGGLVGVLFLIAAVVAAMLIVRNERPLPLGVLFLFLAGSYLLVAGQFSGDYYDSRLMWFFFVLSAVEARRQV